MTWSDVETTGSECDQVLETPLSTPFSQERRRRLTVMSLVIGGGAVIIMGMRFFVGGPATASAQVEAQRTIASYLLPGDAPSPSDDASLAMEMLSRNRQPSTEHLPRAVHANPFILPGSLQAVVMDTPRQQRPSQQHLREQELQSIAGDMHVSMVLLGRTTMAIIDGHTIRLNEPVELPDNVNLTLRAVHDTGIHVQLNDVAMDITYEAILPKP